MKQTTKYFFFGGGENILFETIFFLNFFWDCENYNAVGILTTKNNKRKQSSNKNNK